MTSLDILHDIISLLDPEDVPIDFIVMARITDFKGDERVVRGEELQKIMANPELYQISEARVILNVKKLKKAIIEEVNTLYDQVNRRFNQTYLSGPDEDSGDF